MLQMSPPEMCTPPVAVRIWEKAGNFLKGKTGPHEFCGDQKAEKDSIANLDLHG